MEKGRDARDGRGLRWWELTALIAILVAAAALRLWRLDSVPPGLTHDEAGHGHDAVAILRGARPIYETVGYGREPLYDYVVAGLMALFGPTGHVLRFSSVSFGLVALLATFGWVRLAFDRSIGLAATALQAASFWSLSTSRQALRSSLLPALFTAAVFFHWRSIGSPTRGSQSRPGRWQMGLFALLIGATLYTYIPARVLWVIFPAFLIYLRFSHREVFRRVWLPTSIAVLVGLLLAAPLFVYLQRNPEAEQRLAMLDAPLQALLAGDVSVVLRRAWSCLAGFFVPGQGDDFLAYNIPGRPIFGPVTGVLFLGGVALCLAKWRQPACAFSLLWFLLGISPSLVTGASASITRSIAAMPVAFLLPALAWVEGTRRATRRWKAVAPWLGRLGFAGLVAVTGALAVRDYFVRWGESPDVRAAYRHTLVKIAEYVDTEPGNSGPVGISTVYPYAPHDPYVFEMSLRRPDRSAGLSSRDFVEASTMRASTELSRTSSAESLSRDAQAGGRSRRSLSLRWFDARRALLVPPTPTARLITPSSAPLAPYFANLPGMRRQERVTLRPDDLDPFFVVYDWEPQASLAALQERTQNCVIGLSGEASSDLEPPVNFGDALQLLGCDLCTPTATPGGTVELMTLWRVTDPATLRPRNLSDVEEELVFFTHALDGAGNVIGQEDRLDAPAWDWQAGDVIAQIHRFTLLTDLSLRPIALEVGAYRRADMTRLPVLVKETVVSDHVFLQPVEIAEE